MRASSFAARMGLWLGLLAVAPVALAQWSRQGGDELYSDLAAIDPAEHIERLASVPSRFTGYAGCTEAERYIYQRYRALGLANIERQPFQAIVPVDRGAVLKAGGRSITLYCVRPNYVRTPKTTETGLGGELVWGGQGYIEEFNGKDIAGNIVLMHFNTATRWLNAAKLGARAIIFIEPLQAFRTDAEQKYLTVPAPVPRYYLRRADLPALAAAVSGGESRRFDEEGALALLEQLGTERHVSGTILADMAWEEATVYIISGEVPGTDPVLSEQVVVCHAYYDSTSVVPALSPGAESACGIAAQLEIAEFLLKHPPARTVKFLATPGHFQALAGARAYAQRTIYPRRVKVTGSEQQARAGEPFFFIGLDLSSRQDSMAGFYKGNFYDQDKNSETRLQRVYSDYSSLLMQWAGQVAGPGRLVEGLEFQSGIVPQHGRKWRSLLPDTAAFDSEIVTLCGRPAITLATTGDARNAVNTPLDTFENLRPYLDNVRRQAIVCAYIVWQTARLPVIPLNGQLELGRVGSIFGQAIEQSLSAYVPTVKVPDAVVGINLSQSKSLMGVTGRCFARSDVQGLFEVFGLPLPGQVVLDGFVLSPSDGSVQSVSKSEPGVVTPSDARRLEWELRRTDVRLNFFDCVSTTIFDLVDPLTFILPATAETLRGEAHSAVRAEELVTFTGSNVPGTSYAEPVAVVFTKGGFTIQFVASSGVLLGIPVEPEAKESAVRRTDAEDLFLGHGFSTDEPENFIWNTAYRMATDMHMLDFYRLYVLQKTAIRKKTIWDLHKQAEQHLAAAGERLRQKRYDEFYREARMAWALERRVYPDVKGTAHDVVRGIIFYFALLLPFVIFAERLLINYVDIRKKLAAIAGLFALSYLVLRMVHPAFKLSRTPIIVLDGFFMLVASLWTIGYLLMRFQGVMEHVRRRVATIHRADVARASAAMAAFILGISNMRKRKVRTLLTATTLILLTFTILSFTSFETMPANLLRYASSKKAPYEGLLVRSLAWAPLSEFQGYDLCNHFRTEGLQVAPRSWFVSREPNEELRIEISRTHGRWLDRSHPDWPFVCVVPRGMQESLMLEPEDVGTARVSVLGRTLTVVGFLDSSAFFSYEDLDEEPITPVDFVAQQYQLMGGAAQEGPGPALTATGEMAAEDFVAAMRKGEKQGLYVHMEPDRVLIVPHELCTKLGGTLRAIAAGLGRVAESGAAQGHDAAGSPGLRRSFLHSLTEFASRVNLPLYAGIDGFINRVATRAKLSVGGLQGLLVPIMIAALIVFNTMLGAVYERVGEIKVYASVGLAPIHIAALFLAESCVFAVLGAMMGYLLGQVVSFGLIQVPWLMEGISLNYSSISAVWSALLVMAVVLASTIYPAHMAGKLSVPDETRKMVLPRPEGDVWEIWFPFTVSSREALGVMSYMREYFVSNDEDSVGAFTADEVEFYAARSSPDGPVDRIVLEASVWVAPLDMGISQRVRIASVPDPEEPDITYLFFTIVRKSGEFATWHRMNLGFLKDLRKQLLIWRLVTASEKKRLTEEGQQLLAGAQPRLLAPPRAGQPGAASP